MKEIAVLFNNILTWLIGNQRNLRPGRVAKLEYTIRITRKCRYNAAKRLQVQSFLTQITTIVVSLILIIIPLLQLSDVNLRISEKLTTAMQCYFAVVMLVYTVINTKDNKELRIQKLLECGSRLNRMNRKFNIPKEGSTDISNEEQRDVIDVQEFTTEELNRLNNEYDEILQVSENHKDIDHLRAKMDMREHKITGFNYIYSYLAILYHFIIENLASFLILGSAFVFFFHLIGWINWITP